MCGGEGEDGVFVGDIVGENDIVGGNVIGCDKEEGGWIREGEEIMDFVGCNFFKRRNVDGGECGYFCRVW